MKRLLKIIVLVLYSITCSAQGNRLVDSLKHALKGNTDTIEVNILNKISYELSGDDNAGALKYAQQALEISKNINYKKNKKNDFIQSKYYSYLQYIQNKVGVINYQLNI